MSNDFYVYTLTNSLTGCVFYVGKGRKKRMFDHEKEVNRGHQCHRCNLIRDIIAQGGVIIKTKVYEYLTEAEAFKMEAQVIEACGYETLINQQRGHTREFKRRVRGVYQEKWGHITTIGKDGLYSSTPYRLDIPGDREKAVAMLQSVFEEVVEIPA